MALDWHKMRNNLRTDPRVIHMSTLTRQRVVTIVGACSVIWGIADEHSRDGSLPGYTPKAVDAITEVKGFAAAMQAVGWLEFDQDGCRIVRWEEHNGRGAKDRADEQRRKRVLRMSRKCPGNVPEVPGQKRDQNENENENENENDTKRQETPPPPKAPIHPTESFRHRDRVREIVAAFPNRTGGAQARSDVRDAMARIAGARDDGWPSGVPPPPDAAAWLLGRVRAYAESTEARSESGKYVPAIGKWMREARYLDDEQTWNRIPERTGPAGGAGERRAAQRAGEHAQGGPAPRAL